MSDILSMEEVRVLGALIEKETTTPDYYPLTLNSLINACNQKSNREPVVVFDDRTVLRAIDQLRDRQFAWMVDAVDSRVPKYEQNFTRHLNLTLQEVAVVCVLLLRGAQTIGEIRSRCARIYPFDSMDEVAVTLDTLADREEPLVTRLPLQPGRKEARFAHLLQGEPEVTTAPVYGDPVQPAAPPVPTPAPAPMAPVADTSELEERIELLEEEVSSLRSELDTLTRALAEFKAQFE